MESEIISDGFVFLGCTLTFLIEIAYDYGKTGALSLHLKNDYADGNK